MSDTGNDEAETSPIHVTTRTVLNGPVLLAPYDPAWPGLFEAEAVKIRRALGDDAVVHHAGSTSIPGISAKPLIDIVLEVADSADEAAYVPALEAQGYRLHIRESDWFEHRLLKGEDPEVNMHVFSTGCSEIERMLAFRDWLRTHDHERSLYERTKQELAARHWKYTQDYADAKGAVVEAIIARALAARR